MQLKTHLLLSFAATSATLVSAQTAPSAGALAAFGPLVTGLSAPCTGAFATFISDYTNPLSNCLNITTFFGGLTQLSSNASLTPLFESYLGGPLCANPACSPQVISAANASLNAACTDADRALNSGANVATLFRSFLNIYYPIKDAACLSDSKNGENCIVEAV